MAEKILSNPFGALGYGSSDGFLPGGEANVRTFRNSSTAQVIPRGAAVVWSTLGVQAQQVTITTVIGSPLFCGIAITSASLNTENTTVSSNNRGPGSDICQVVVDGPVFGALVTSGTVPGDVLWTVNSTVAGSTGGGYLGPAASSIAAVAFVGVAGIAFSSGTTGTTGFLGTVGPRALVQVQKSINALSSV
jgi:hypothetical protein